MERPTHVLVFTLGFIGALAPEIVRLYSLRRKPRGEVFSLWYCAVSLAFAALGGVVALLLPATTPWGAFYAGITTPTLISAAFKHRMKATKPAQFINERPDNIIRAIDPTLGRDDKTIRASEPKRNLGWWIELIRNHADGLFI